jgi:hypothetical protein
VAVDLDRLRVALQRELAGDRQVVARTADVLRLEAELREALGVEEVWALEVSFQVGVLDLDAADLGRPSQDAIAEASVELGESALERARQIGNGEPDRGVNAVDAPGAGWECLLCGLIAYVGPFGSSKELACSTILAEACAINLLPLN